MWCFRSRIMRPVVRRLRAVAGDDHGVAGIEAVLIFALLAGVFLACLMLGQWGAGLQASQMGARLLAFDAGDTALAKLGRPSRVPTQLFLSPDWDTLVDTLVDTAKSRWLANTFGLSNDLFRGTVTGSAQGREPGQRSLFDYARTSMGYRARNWSASTNAWGIPESVATDMFLLMWGNVVMNEVDSGEIVTMTVDAIPPQIAILETIFTRVGIR